MTEGGSHSASAELFSRGLGYVAVTVARAVGTLAVVPIIARTLGPKGFGSVATVQAIAAVLATIAQFGFPSAITRQFFDPVSGGAVNARRLLTVAVASAVAFAAIAAGTGDWWGSVILSEGSSVPLGLASLWAAPMAVLAAQQAILRSQDRLVGFSATTLALTMAGPIGGIAGTSLFERTSAAYVLGALVALTVSAIGSLVVIPPSMDHAFDSARVRAAVAIGLPLMPHSVAMWLLNAGDRVIVERVLGLTEVGRYQLAYAVGSIGILFLQGVQNAWGPRVYAISDDDERNALLGDTRDYILRLMVPVTAGISLGAPIALRVVGSASYRPDDLVVVTSVVAASSIVYVPYLVYVRVLFYERTTTSLAWVTPIGAAFNVVMNLALVNAIGLIGAALSTFLSYSLLAWAVTWSTQSMPRPTVRGWLVWELAVTSSVVLAVGILLPTDGRWLSVRFILGVASVAWFLAESRAAMRGWSIRQRIPGPQLKRP